ncbi:Putative zinc-finger [Lentzea fradiae]|uniref:Putative zinc-finger n=1 Tax=Lentzea fradiae TaxID=200378 RepID=A0A1G7NR59_9PSEU|nr:zf-HC2 domain-containing protein [Lentzea fradiae]SDF76482.1 Putative zinc-finger [Lentzea fradiae]
MTAHHPTDQSLRRYERGDDDIPADELWAVESHLENCAPCRARLVPDPVATAVWAELQPALDRTPQMPRARRRWNGWFSPAAAPWLAMVVLVTAAAVALDRLGLMAGERVSVVLLVAPLLPVLGVAASWSRALDPAHELVSATPRAGLPLVFRRTAAVLAVVVPGLSLAGLVTGVGFTLWLLPCLAFTVGTLALGTLVGITRAALALTAAWATAIAGPPLLFQRTPLLLDTALTPLWLALLAAGLVVVVLRRMAFTRLETNL